MPRNRIENPSRLEKDGLRKQIRSLHDRAKKLSEKTYGPRIYLVTDFDNALKYFNSSEGKLGEEEWPPTHADVKRLGRVHSSSGIEKIKIVKRGETPLRKSLVRADSCELRCQPRSLSMPPVLEKSPVFQRKFDQVIGQSLVEKLEADLDRAFAAEGAGTSAWLDTA